ncbi:MAG: ABC transporter substrate-binding protein [Gemmatimonadota bacterium]
MIALPGDHAVTFAGLYVAEDEGLFGERGLDVGYLHAADPGQSLAVVGNGQAAFAVVPAADLVSARTAGLPVMSVAVLEPAGWGGDAAPAGSYGRVLATSYDLLERDTALVRAVVGATVHGWNRAIESPAAAAAAVTERVSGSELQAAEQWLRDRSAGLPADSQQVGRSNAAGWSALMAALRDGQRIGRPVHVQTVFTDAYLPYPPRIRR